MAKGKRAVALFEVIRQDKRFQAKTPASEPKRTVDFSARMAEEAADLWRKRNSDPETWTYPKEKIGKSFAALNSGLNAAWQTARAKCSSGARAAAAWIARIHGVATGAAAAGIIIGAVMLARHYISPGVHTGAVEAAIEAGPPHPSVLAVGPGRAAPAAPSPELQMDVMQASDAAPANLAEPGKRVINMHYVLMQSYFDRKTAEEARDFLDQNGIACTIEQGVKGWRPDFYQVIGLQGFPRASGPEYLAYRHRVEDLGLQFSPKSRYKRFTPQAIKW